MRAVFVLLVAAVFVATSYAADEVPKGRINCYQCSSGADDQHECDESDPEKLKKFIKPCGVMTSGAHVGKEANSCRKVLQKVAEVNSVTRECAYTGNEEVDGTRRTGNNGIIVYFYQCFNENNNNPCNSSNAARIAWLLSVVAMLVLLL
ncbi:Protein C15H9.9 [Aphelenchoides avenae]|nr:Protein C15H9.9 [Aphelenchus avenae]